LHEAPNIGTINQITKCNAVFSAKKFVGTMQFTETNLYSFVANAERVQGFFVPND